MSQMLKLMYRSIPYKQNLFSFLKLFYTPSPRIFKHLHFKGVIEVPINEGKKFFINHYGFQIENEIFWSGLTNGWEKVSINLWIQLCKDSSVILDIGANTGVYALVAKTINPDAKVFAFEPVNRVFDKLKQNIKLNSYDIVMIEKAVSDKSGTAVIFDTNAEHTLSVTVNRNMVDSELVAIETKIQTIRLDDFIREYDLNIVDLIKIDVETHEPEVLQGFSEYLSIFKPTLLIEILDEEVALKVQNLVDGLGYLYFNIDEENGIRQVDKVTKSDYYNYLFCNEKVAQKLNLS
jgi:FkbM family methyltransferase